MRETTIRIVAMTLSRARGQEWQTFPTARQVLRQARFEELAEKIVTQVETGMADFHWREPPRSRSPLLGNAGAPRPGGANLPRPRAAPPAPSDSDRARY